jgi:hypothetical protein
MKQIIFSILFFYFFPLTAQEIAHKEILKKCRKEFSKKICLQDDDEDTIPNYLDQCRIDAGPSENSGCPWPDHDGDGVKDIDDGCSYVPGPVDNNGCPWPDTDGDGILDKDDQCPTEQGLSQDQGCPKPNCNKYRENARRATEEYIVKQKRIDYPTLQKIFLENIRKVHFDSPLLLFVNDNVEEGEGPSACPSFTFPDLQIENYNTGYFLWNENSIIKISEIVRKPIFPISTNSFWWNKGGFFRVTDDDYNTDFKFLNEEQKKFIRNLSTINHPVYGAIYYKEYKKNTPAKMPSKFNMVKYWQTFEIIDNIFQTTVEQEIITGTMTYKKVYVFSLADKVWRLKNEMEFPTPNSK